MKNLNKVTIALSILIALLYVGCKPNQHVWDELELCKERFKEDCTLVVIPLSKGKEIEVLHKQWNKDT